MADDRNPDTVLPEPNQYNSLQDARLGGKSQHDAAHDGPGIMISDNAETSSSTDLSHGPDRQAVDDVINSEVGKHT